MSHFKETAPNGLIRDEEILGDKAHVSHDEALKFGVLTPEELIIEKKLKRKIDSLIMPLVVLVYLLNYESTSFLFEFNFTNSHADRNNYAAARLQGLEKDLHLTASQYQTALSLLFVGYIIGQVPSNLLLNYCGRPSYYLGFFIIAWGLVSACTSQVKSYQGIVACRFILGLVESPFFPGVLFYLSKWYTKKELNLRMSIFYSGSLISGAFGSLIAAGILNGLNGSLGLKAWQWLYIIEGTITVAVGIVIVFILPDFPSTWKLLSPEMKHVAERRLAIDAAELDEDEAGGMSQWTGFKLAMTDSKTYILAIAYMCSTGAAGFQNFFPTLTATLGYSHIISLILVAPPYLFITFWALGHSILSDKMGHRFWFFMYPIPLTIIGYVVFMSTKHFGARYFSLFLAVFVFSMNGTTYAWVASSIPRPPAKRAAAFAFINAIGNSASIWTPFTYRKGDSPYYRLALGFCIGLQIVAGCMGVLLRIVLTRENKRLERMENENVQLSPADLARLERTAEKEGIDVAAARRLQKGYRYTI